MNKSDENTIKIWTDGACSGNPGPGGWGAVLIYGTHEKDISGYAPDTTNNRMELEAAVQALNALSRPCSVILTTDSQYVRQGITQWLHNWKKRNWTTASKKPVKNVDLWKALDEASKPHTIDWQWVKGHSGDVYNDRADALAREAITTKGQ